MPLPWLTVAVSDDGDRYRVVGHFNGLASPRVDKPGDVRRILEVTGLQTRARYVALLVRTSGWYIFGDEVEVLRGDHTIASVSFPSPGAPLDKLVESAQPNEMLCLSRELKEFESTLAGTALTTVERDAWDTACAFLEHCKAGVGYAALPDYLDAIGPTAARLRLRVKPSAPFWLWSSRQWEDTTVWQSPESFTDELKTLTTTVEQNGWRSQSFLITNTSPEPSTVMLKAKTPPSASSPRLSVRYGYQVPCPDLRLRPDALLPWPRGGLRIRAGQTVPVWLTLDTRKSRLGRYHYDLTLASRRAVKSVALEVEVALVRLPDKSPVHLFTYSYVKEMPQTLDRVAETKRDLREHWVNTFVLPGYVPKAQSNEQGELIGKTDFSKVDEGLQLHRKDTIVWWLGGDIKRSVGLFPNLRNLSPEWKKAVKTLYQKWMEHLRQKGLGYQEFLVYPFDESTRPEVLEVSKLLKEADPKARLFLNPTGGCQQAELEALVPFVDTWVPNAEHFVLPNAKEYQLMKSSGRQLWMYTCVNGKNQPPYGYYRLKHWLAFREGITGIGFWGYADSGGWTDDNPWDWALGDFTLIYTDKHAPRDVRLNERISPSKRWEAFREGAQDYMLLAMLREAIGTAAGSAAAKARAFLDQTVKEVMANPTNTELADGIRSELLTHIVACRKG
ncbi:MAG: DUF4091 domain-containing protein [Armatimonadetes bacterium]|nr:DUF4091 domain-containing protein [Armatimonadota bacterium]